MATPPRDKNTAPTSSLHLQLPVDCCKMPVYTCAVNDCTSSSRRKNEDVKGWSVFPRKKQRGRRKLWETRCKRGPRWRATKDDAICSKHFIDWCEGPSPSHPDPELFAYNQWGKSKVTRKSVYKRQSQPSVSNNLPHSSAPESSSQSTPPQDDVLLVVPSSITKVDYYASINQEVQDCIQVEIESRKQDSSLITDGDEIMPFPRLHEDHSYVMSSIATTVAAEPVDAAVQVDMEADIGDTLLDQRARTRDMILNNAKSVRMYTGLPSKQVLMTIFEVIKKRVKKICYWGGQKSVKENKLKTSSGGQNKIMDHFDEYLITLVHIRQGMTRGVLADLFGVSKTSVTSIINTWINLLYQILKNWLIWPSAEQVKRKLPKNYPSKYADTRVILDCTEFFHIKPRNCSSQVNTHSQYKHHNIIKVLIGTTPRGMITFVSNPYGGNAFDRYIAEKEILDKLEPGDAVMVDRGFDIGDLLLQHGIKLHMPPFTGKTLNQSEILKTREIASLQKHVEHAIERMRNFKILTKTLNSHLRSLLYQVLVIVAVFCNLGPPVLKH